MTSTLSITASKISLWMARNPVATRVVLTVLPFAAALVAAVLTNSPIYAGPCDGGSGSCGGG